MVRLRTLPGIQLFFDFYIPRMIVPSRWIRQWLIFTHYKMGEEPGRISMLTLLKQDKNTPGGWRPKKNLQSPCNKLGEERSGHYRCDIGITLVV